jgi:hypothetical protein
MSITRTHGLKCHSEHSEESKHFTYAQGNKWCFESERFEF